MKMGGMRTGKKEDSEIIRSTCCVEAGRRIYRERKEIGELQENLKRPEGKTAKEMQQFHWEATKSLVSD
jgi:hypothetical protein